MVHSVLDRVAQPRQPQLHHAQAPPVARGQRPAV